METLWNFINANKLLIFLIISEIFAIIDYRNHKKHNPKLKEYKEGFVLFFVILLAPIKFIGAMISIPYIIFTTIRNTKLKNKQHEFVKDLESLNNSLNFELNKDTDILKSHLFFSANFFSRKTEKKVKIKTIDYNYSLSQQKVITDNNEHLYLDDLSPITITSSELEELGFNQLENRKFQLKINDDMYIEADLFYNIYLVKKSTQSCNILTGIKHVHKLQMLINSLK